MWKPRLMLCTAQCPTDLRVLDLMTVEVKEAVDGMDKPAKFKREYLSRY